MPGGGRDSESDARAGSPPNPFNFVYGTREAAAAASSLAGCRSFTRIARMHHDGDCRVERDARVTFKHRTADRMTRQRGKSRFLKKTALK